MQQPNAKDLEYVNILKSLGEIPFSVGKKLLTAHVLGDFNNKSVARNSLDKLDTFGSLRCSKGEANSLIENLIMNKMIEYTTVPGNNFWKVLQLTANGIEEIQHPTLYKKKLGFNFKENFTKITENDREAFKAFDFFLGRYNERQKKGIISNSKKILCIAGAGSGKTTVLTKRIEMLTQYKSIKPEKILAITFTRKARAEMMSRLAASPYCIGVKIETFNSFCEKMLIAHNDKVYDRPVRVINYRDRIKVMNLALSQIKMKMEQAIDVYFTAAQQRGRTMEGLAHLFMNDCFSILEYFKTQNQPLQDFSKNGVLPDQVENAKMVYDICRYIHGYMHKKGLRDYADQLIDALYLFDRHKDCIPEFEHILIDEYQDINSTQIGLIDVLNAPNLFCVGDPRQSIFGWRGSKIQYILNFEDKYPECEVIAMTKNYRSTENLVKLINLSVKSMGFPDLKSSISSDAKNVKLLNFENENGEFEFIIQRILSSELSRNEIFVLARTNRQLKELSNKLKLRGLKHVIRTDEMRTEIIAKKDEITLSTIHSIKGMEAAMVFVIGCTSNNFPCRGSDHPVMDMVKTNEYDIEEEERRLFYVAMSRAKQTLYLSYTGNNLTRFMDEGMQEIIESEKIDIKPSEPQMPSVVNSQPLSQEDTLKRLKGWRSETCRKLSIPAYMVFQDKTLIELVQKNPMSNSELENIKGFGPVKIMKYGEEILKVLNGIG